MSRFSRVQVCFACRDFRPEGASSLRVGSLSFCSPDCAMRFFESGQDGQKRVFLTVQGPYGSLLDVPGSHRFCCRECLVEALRRDQEFFDRCDYRPWYEGDE